MRKVQIDIHMRLYGDLASDGKIETVNVYADANNVWEAICAAIDELLFVLKEIGNKLPLFGCKEHS